MIAKSPPLNERGTLWYVFFRIAQTLRPAALSSSPTAMALRKGLPVSGGFNGPPWSGGVTGTGAGMGASGMNASSGESSGYTMGSQSPPPPGGGGASTVMLPVDRAEKFSSPSGPLPNRATSPALPSAAMLYSKPMVNRSPHAGFHGPPAS